MRLGDKLKSTIAACKDADRVAQELKHQQALEHRRRDRAKILEWLRDWKTDTIHAIENGHWPKPVRIPHYVNFPSTGSIGDTKHPHHDLLLPFLSWAQEEGLEILIQPHLPDWPESRKESRWEISVRSV